MFNYIGLVTSFVIFSTFRLLDSGNSNFNGFQIRWVHQGKVYGFVPMGDSNPDTEVGMIQVAR